MLFLLERARRTADTFERRSKREFTKNSKSDEQTISSLKKPEDKRVNKETKQSKKRNDAKRKSEQKKERTM